MVSSILVLEVSDNSTGKSKKKYIYIRIENKDRTTTKKNIPGLPGDWVVKTLSFHCRGCWFSPCMSHIMAKTNKEKLYLFTNNVIV